MLGARIPSLGAFPVPRATTCPLQSSSPCTQLNPSPCRSSPTPLPPFAQVSAHGTGACIPPVDEPVVALTLVTPGRGTLSLSERESPDLFRLARVGLGALGAVSQLTLQCVPAHRLMETSFVATRAEVQRNHKKCVRPNQAAALLLLKCEGAVQSQ